MPVSRADRFAHTVAAVPPWFEVAKVSRTSMQGVVTLASDSASGPERAVLDVSLEASGVRVRETVPGTRYPSWCPERHIEDGGWFCLGLSSGWMVEDARTAATWWSALEDFLRLQRTAARSGMWPDQNALSHGEAGRHHQRALTLAAEIGLLEDYERHTVGEPSIVTRLDALLVRDGTRLINGRLPCPCGKRRRGKPVLRRNCPRRDTVLVLLAEERARVAKLASYWKLTSGLPCCGTMRACPLRDQRR